MAAKEEQVEALFGKLETQLRNRQTKRALKTTDEILKLSPKDSDAVAVKVPLLIDLGSSADALALIDASPDLASSLAFERAYCTYRLGRLQEALTALSGVGPDRTAARLQLEAQVQYRLGNYPECITVYNKLFAEHKGELEATAEATTNIIAALAIGGRAGDIPSTLASLRASAADSFELGFNAACGLIESGRLDDAAEALALARRSGEEQLYEEELEEDEVEAELAPISAQLAYLAARQGRLEEAVEALRSALDCSDQAVGAAAAVDLAAVLLRQRPGDRRAASEALKALDPFLERSGGYLRVKTGLDGRLGPAHCEALLTSYAAAAVGAGKLDFAREALRSVEKAHKGSPAAALLGAALLARDGKVKEATAALEETAGALAGSPAALAAALTRVQLAAAGGDAAGAAALLAALPAAEQRRPAVLATRAALLEAAGDLDGAAEVARAALSAGADGAAARWALRRLAALNIRRGDLEAATADLRRLADVDAAALEDPDTLCTLPRLVAACDPAAAADLAARLPKPPALPAAEVDALEAAGASGARRAAAAAEVPVTAAAKAANPEAAAAAEAAEKKRKKRKRKIRYPKGFDPENPGPMPDPERWVPKWQRSDAKKARKKKRAGEVVKGSQGAGKVDASLDASLGPAPSAAAAAPAASGKGGSSKKKKGRR